MAEASNELIYGVLQDVQERVSRAYSDPIESGRRSSSLVLWHFLRRTGVHFVGKCSSLQDGQRSTGDALTAVRGHQLLLQRDIHNIHERLDGIEKKVGRTEHRLQLSDATA